MCFFATGCRLGHIQVWQERCRFTDAERGWPSRRTAERGHINSLGLRSGQHGAECGNLANAVSWVPRGEDHGKEGPALLELRAILIVEDGARAGASATHAPIDTSCI